MINASFTTHLMIRFLSLLLVLTAAGCSSGPCRRAEGKAVQDSQGDEPASGHHAEHARQAKWRQPLRVLDDGSQLYGSELSAGREITALAAILSNPQLFQGRNVKTEGEIVQVCPRMGCWLELRADAESPIIHVPMAEHSFFLPLDAVGRRATIEGTVSVRELSDEQRAHLESEGAQAASQSVSIEATAVLVRAAGEQ